MTLVKPYLALKRLIIVSHSGHVAYDQVFHKGVNIIRGRNSSGKSTIANFIFYALGGDYSNWTTHALKCEAVFAEVIINDAVLTLKRSIVRAPNQSMQIFWGPYEMAIKSNFDGWQAYPYRLTDNKQSFSNVIFNALDFPEVRSESDDKITMHQILRLIYIDQESPIQNVFRSEKFDPPLTRQAISELLLGVYDDMLYNSRLELRDAKKKYEEKKKEFDGVSRVFGSTGNQTSIVVVQKEIELTRKRLKEIQEEITKIREKNVVTLRSTTPLKIEALQKEASEVKTKIYGLKSEIQDYEYEILDSKQFVESLEKRIAALDNSILTRKVLGELPLMTCPQCLSPLANHVPENTCGLCKQPLSEENEKTHAKRLKQELEMQVKESNQLLESKNTKLAELLGELPPYIEKARSLQREIDLEEKENKPTRDSALDELFVTKGGLENKIEFLTNQIKAVEMLDLLKKELQDLSKKIEELDLEIRLKIDQQQNKLSSALIKIEELTLKILRKDLDRQTEFKVAQNVEVDFSKDVFKLDGANNFSQSSNFLLKNAVRFAIFFASLEYNFFRYPRFLLCDNMEDKGIELVRAQNFQKIVVELSGSYDVEHQIIFTTSMIEPILNNETYCIGDEYSETNKTLHV